jgi:hypothetical protein
VSSFVDLQAQVSNPWIEISLGKHMFFEMENIVPAFGSIDVARQTVAPPKIFSPTIIFFFGKFLLLQHRYSPFVVSAAESGEPRPLYRGMYMVGGYGQEYFFLTWVEA